MLRPVYSRLDFGQLRMRTEREIGDRVKLLSQKVLEQAVINNEREMLVSTASVCHLRIFWVILNLF